MGTAAARRCSVCGSTRHDKRRHGGRRNPALRVGQSRSYSALGRTVTVKKVKQGVYAARDENNRVRWGDAREIASDLRHFRQTGALPRSAGGWA